MKDYNEVVQDVLKRSAEKIENNKKRQRIILRTASCYLPPSLHHPCQIFLPHCDPCSHPHQKQYHPSRRILGHPLKWYTVLPNSLKLYFTGQWGD